MNRINIINHLIQKNGYKSYLEIGCQNNATFDSVQCDIKKGVDPEKGGTHKMDSDTFFSQNQDMFDIVFVDGLHHSEQVLKDIDNALKFLNKGGTVVVHDLLPWNKELQIVPRIQKAWTGDCWKAWVKLRSTKGNLKMYVVDTDTGCGIIQRGRQAKIEIPEVLTYELYVENRQAWMNVISVEDFQKL